MYCLTDEVINFLIEYKKPPNNVKKKALEHIIDGVAVMLAGSRTEAAHKAADYIKTKGASLVSSVIGFPFKTGVSDAALINGISGHADDYDDTQLSTMPDRIYGLLTHPTVPVLASALAVGESIDASGEEVLDAFIAGFEVECKLAETIKPEHYKRGFHSTATMGTFGSFAATGQLMELEETELRHSLGIATSLSSGIRVNFGTMTKPLHAGMAASNGITACLLGRRGFTSNIKALDGEWGFMQILGGGADPEMIADKLGNPYSIIDPGATIKMYPCGSLAQPSMDALLEIIEENNLRPEDVKEIILYAGPNILEPLRYGSPKNGLEAKFSLQFGLATILLRHRAGLREYTDEWVNNKKLRETIKKIKTIYDEEIAKMGTDKMISRIKVELIDGNVLERFADTARGTPEKPLELEDLQEKFFDCASYKLTEETMELVLSKINQLNDLPRISELTKLLTNNN